MVTVSIAEAAQRLGVSEKTVRRRLGGGALRGERISRPQGYTWAVHLQDDMDARPHSEPGAFGTHLRSRWERVAPGLRHVATRPVTFAVLGLSLATLLRRATRRSGRAA